MINSASVGTWAHDRVSVRSEFLMISFKGAPSFFSTSLKDDNHKAAHKEGSIRLLSIVERGVMIYLILTILFIADQFFQLFAEQMNFS